MLFGEVLQFVIIQIATEPNRCQDQDVPVVHSFPTAVITCSLLDVMGDEVENLVSKFRRAVDVLQCRQNGYDFIATIEIQLNFGDRPAIEPWLGGKRFSHPYSPRR